MPAYCDTCDKPLPTNFTGTCADCRNQMATARKRVTVENFEPLGPPPPQPPPKSLWNIPVGLFLVGLSLLCQGLMMSVSIDGTVINVDLMSQRQMFVFGGGACMMTSLVLLAIRR